MEKEIKILAIVLLVSTGFVGCKQSVSQNDDFITVDVTTGYPEKELILQDFMDVEYVALETTDDFLTQGSILDIGEEIILVRNNINDGDIFVYDRSGKAIRKINRLGQGNEEYVSYSFGKVMLDEENSEIFIDDRRRIAVYDLFGNFLRSLPRSQSTNYSKLLNYDREHLICREISIQIDEKSTESQPFAIISKKDGSMVHDIRIRFEQGINTIVMQTGSESMMAVDLFANTNTIIPFRDSWVLLEFSSDTIFRLLPDFSITAFMARTPSVHSRTPEILFLPILLTDRYIFSETFKKEIERVPGFFRKTKLAYDRQEKKTYIYSIINDDYSIQKTLDFSAFYSNKTIAFWQKIEAHELIEANEKGELKGKLKELTEELEDDPNPVIMLVKNRK